MSIPKLIAFYLPQYHPTPHNDEWWGKGFTEWINVAKAKPLFRGHEQPHIPGELGFYDLRLPEIREAQASLAKEYGIYGFCYYYYRFAKGKNELELPLNEVLKSGKPDFPFMVCWANESWHKKFWNFDGSAEKQILIKQEYNGNEDYVDFFYELLPFFKDNRYIKLDGKPVFMIYKPAELPDSNSFISLWNSLAQRQGFKGIFFIGYTLGNLSIKYTNSSNVLRKAFLKEDITKEKSFILSKGFDAIALNRTNFIQRNQNSLKRILRLVHKKLFHRPFVFQYKEIVNYLVGSEESDDNIFPVVIPNWDHTPRSKFGGLVWQGSTPIYYEQYLKRVLSYVSNKNESNQIVFLKSWNEWGEGNYIEPDLKWGRQYLEATQSAINSIK